MLPESYVIFITENDVWKRGLARYHVNRVIEELNQRFEDGEHILYVNGAYQGTDAIGSLMNDFRCDTAENMMLHPLKEAVYRYKNNPEEVAIMCAELEKWSLEERQEGRQEGESRLTALLKLLKADHRWQDLDLAIEREDVREKLYREYHME